MKKKRLQFQINAKVAAKAKAFGPGRIEFKNLAGGETEISIYGEIGDSWYDEESTTAAQFKRDLDTIPKGREILVRINSPGGNVFDGFAIHNALAERRANVVTRVDGVAASIASVIALAGRSCEMATLSNLMAHPAWGMCMGNAEDMAQTGALLQKLSDQIAGVYSRASGKSVEECTAMMAAETWMTGPEALTFGLCDKLTDPEEDPEETAEPQDNFDRRRVPANKAPNQPAKNSGAIQNKMNRTQTIALLNELGITFAETATDADLTNLLLNYKKPAATPAPAPAAGLTQDDVKASVATEVARVLDVTNRVQACVTELKIPGATQAQALKRALADETYLTEIEAYTPRQVGVDPPAADGGAAPKPTKTFAQFEAMEHRDRNAFIASGGKING